MGVLLTNLQSQRWLVNKICEYDVELSIAHSCCAPFLPRKFGGFDKSFLPLGPKFIINHVLMIQ